MAFIHKEFDLGEIERDIDPGRLRWPNVGEAGFDSGFGGNRHYDDQRGVGWSEVQKTIEAEEAFVRRIEEANNPEAVVAAIADERERAWDAEGDPLWGMDLGVAGAALAITASRCIAYSSCNAGAFGDGHHQERYPIVAFMLRRQFIPIFLTIAEDVGAGFHAAPDGGVALFGPNVRTVMRFGQELYERRSALKAVRLDRPRKANRKPPRDDPGDDGQGNVF